jgi:putative peptidoglycan lipid II flippase
VAFNFVALPVALLATPVGLALLPDVSAAVATDRAQDAAAVARQGLALTAFLTLPAAVGLVLLAEPLADMVARGAMANGHGREITAGAMAFMGPGLVGQSLFFVATQVSYARGGARAPLLCMATQAGLCLAAVAMMASMAPVRDTVELAAAGWSFASVVGGASLTLLVLRGDAPRLGYTAWRAAVACLLMWWPVTWTVSVAQTVAGHYGSVVALVAGSLAGICVYVGVQRLLRAPELAWLWSAMRPRRASSGHLVAP